MAITDTYTFEEGTDGTAIATGNGVLTVTTSNYAKSAAVHGSLGAQLTSTSSSNIAYAATASGQASFYASCDTTTGSASSFFSVRNGNTQLCRLSFNGGTGLIELRDGSNSTVATSATPFAGLIFRADVRYDNTVSTSLVVTVRLFYGQNKEGTIPDETLGPITMTAASSPNRVSFGFNTGGWVINCDTLRLYDDITTWPDPYDPDPTLTGWLSETSAIANSAGSSLTIPVPARGFPAGHFLSLGVFASGTTFWTLTVTDSESNTWNLDQSIFTTAGGSTYQFNCIVGTALTSSDTITISAGTTVPHFIGIIEEFGQIITGSDVGSTGNNGSSSSASPTTSTTTTTTQANELLVGVMGMVSPGRVYMPGPGFTQGTQVKTTSGSGDRALVMQWKQLTSTGTQRSSGTFDSGALFGATVESYKITLPSVGWTSTV